MVDLTRILTPRRRSSILQQDAQDELDAQQQQQQQSPTNYLQQLAPSEPAAVTNAAQMMDQQPQSINSVQQMDVRQEQPREQRPRRSFLETIGRLADVIATVGGADPLYQPGIDSREDRARMVDLEAMKKQQMQQQLAVGGEEMSALQRAKVGAAMKGLQAIVSRGGDVNSAWPILAQQAGIPVEDAAKLGQVFQQDPNAITGIASMFGAEKEFGLQPFYAQDAEGNLQAYQIGKDGSIQPIQLAEGQTPIDPLKFIDTGASQVGVGTRSGRPVRVLPKGITPDKREGIRSSERIAAGNNATRITVAGMRQPAGSTGKPAAGSEAGDVANVLKDFGIVLNGKTDPVADLIKGSTSGAVENVLSMVPGALGQATKGQENIGRLKTIDNAVVLALAGGKLGSGVSNADRDFFKEMSGKISDPNTPANVRLAAWDQIKTRLRGIQQRSASSAAPARNTAPKVAPRGRPSGRSGGGKPSVSNW